MRWMRTIRAALLMTACLGGAAAAADPPAATPGVEAAKKADALFHEGVRFVTQQSWKEAEEKFLGAWALNPTYDVAANLGQTQYRMGKYRDAAEHLAFALKHWPIIGKKEPREGAQKRFEEVRGHVGAVKIQVSVAGATVLVDGKEVGKSPIEIEVYVEPGKRTFAAKLAGYEDAKQTIEATAGGEQSVTMALMASVSAAKVVPAASASAAQSPPVPSAGSSTQRRSVVPGVVLGGAAGVALATSIGLLVNGGAKGSSARDTHDAILKAGHSCVMGASNYDARCAQLSNTGKAGDTLHNVGVGLLVGAGVAAVGAAAYFLWPVSSASRATMSRRRSLSLAPSVSVTSAGLLISGAF
jgi:hypothetical protein